MRKYVLTPQFHKLLSDGDEEEARSSTLIKDGYVELAAGSKDPDAAIPFIASTGDRDRYGDRVSPSGWKLKHFKKNPVILWCHEHGVPPVGRAVKIAVTDGQLIKHVQFQPLEIYPFGHMIGQMVRHKFLNATSVGFNALKFEPTKIGSDENEEELRSMYPYALDFKSQELLESSVVTVPANPFALAQARAAGIDVTPMTEHATKILDKALPTGPLLGAAWYERAYTDTREETTMVDLGANKTDPQPEPAAKPEEEKEMKPREKLAKAVAQLKDAKANLADMATGFQAAVVDAVSELEATLKDCDEFGIELADGTVDRLKAHAHRIAKVLPAEPVPEPEEKELTIEDVDAIVSAIASDGKLERIVVQALDAHTGRLSD
jgi:hypothetical protein